MEIREGLYYSEDMTLTIEPTKQKRQPKTKSTIADRLMAARDRAVAKVPKEDWDAVPKDASHRLEEYMEGQV